MQTRDIDELDEWNRLQDMQAMLDAIRQPMDDESIPHLDVELNISDEDFPNDEKSESSNRLSNNNDDILINRYFYIGIFSPKNEN
jgi:hypothetical protein